MTKAAPRKSNRPKPEPLAEREHAWRPDNDIARHLDMVEPGEEAADRDPKAFNRVNERMEMDMSEADREGDEQSGDDHSSGLQGTDPEEANQPHVQRGLPGEETTDDELIEEDLQHRRIDR